MGLEYTDAKKIVLKTILILGAITVVEVLIALTGKGYIIEGWHWPVWFMAIAMIVLSSVKAYYIIYEFMHMKYEVPDLVKTVLLPTILLVWAIIAFTYEGTDWGDRRTLIENKNKETLDESPVPQGNLIKNLTREDLF
jgi:cytochrome c oxidase subunit IV